MSARKATRVSARVNNYHCIKERKHFNIICKSDLFPIDKKWTFII